MAIPTYDQLLRPLLELSTSQDITRRTATSAMIAKFALTGEEQAEMLPSGGSTYIYSRTGWAMTFLTKGELIEKVAKATYRATSAGRDFLKSHPATITLAHLENDIPGYADKWKAASQKRARAKAEKIESVERTETSSGTFTPEELIDSAVGELEDSLQNTLLEQLKVVDPFRFEQIVIDLLFAMGYGGSRAEAAQVTKKSNDEGIDGVINEDRLGLDVIYVQAKRWQNNVGRTEIQNFVGALAGKQASKGVFITTSSFSQNARDYAASVSQKIILIDGDRLTDLMIEHCIGVSTIRTIELKRIDSDYFDD